MPKLKILSGFEVVKIFSKFGFEIITKKEVMSRSEDLTRITNKCL